MKNSTYMQSSISQSASVLVEAATKIPRGATAVVLAAIVLAGCATQISKGATGIVETDQSHVQACHYLGNVFGTSVYTNLALDFGEQNARNEALNRAANLGATHVVWQGITKEWNTDVSVAAGAYRCG